MATCRNIVNDLADALFGHGLGVDEYNIDNIFIPCVDGDERVPASVMKYSVFEAQLQLIRQSHQIVGILLARAQLTAELDPFTADVALWGYTETARGTRRSFVTRLGSSERSKLLYVHLLGEEMSRLMFACDIMTADALERFLRGGFGRPVYVRPIDRIALDQPIRYCCSIENAKRLRRAIHAVTKAVRSLALGVCEYEPEPPLSAEEWVAKRLAEELMTSELLAMEQDQEEWSY